MIETKAQIALDLVPLMKHLYRGGVLAVNGGTGDVHMTEEFFHEVFPDVLVAMPRASEEYPFEWAAWVDHVKFFALSETGKWGAADGLGRN